jgi:Ca2+-binding RTX toxin-like protein
MTFSVFASSNVIASTHLSQVTRNKLIADFRPAGCAGMTLVNIVYCTGNNDCFGTAQADLILGDSGKNTIYGGNGDDCIIAGAGNDKVDGQGGSNICIEGTGNDSYTNCTVVNP